MHGHPVPNHPGYYWHQVGGSAARPTLAARWGRPRARGAGDVVARMTSAVGIKPCAPCKQRQAKLNRWWSF